MEIMNKDDIREHYHFESEIGEGINTVARGINLETGEEVAIKTIQLKEMSEEDMGYLYTEVQIMSQLDHPNIVKLIEVFEDKDCFYMVMELMKGGDLADAINATEFFSEAKAAKVLYPIVDAIKYCHNYGVVHRDLKPENLFRESVSSDSLLKISDFGMAADVTAAGGELMTTVCGSKDYIAPEILCDEPYGAEVDCWSFGVILFYILSGEPPFFRNDDNERFQAIKACNWSFEAAVWDDISEEAKDLISKLLVRDPTKRLNAAEIIEHPWFKKFIE